ncbi:MAG: MFS transporter [Candidatus Latescibacteria bacterium]|nr:MFS transporter [Candidatus Latescibacterota bacterium]
MGNLLSGLNRNLILLAIATFSVGIFFAVQTTLYNNFVVDRLGIDAHQLGTVEALRETPGFLNALFIGLVMHLAPPLIAGVALIVMGIGFAAYAQVDSVFSLALFSVIWSIGFHCWAPMGETMALTFTPDGEKGKWLGRLRSVGAVAWLLAIGACMLLLDYLHYEGLFVLGGAAVALGGVAILFADHQKPAKPERAWVLKRRYSLYYVLQMLQGCRKQMFITFAIFALIKIHGMPVATTMILVLINQVLVTLTGPLMGRLVDRWGERVMLSLSHLGLIFVFLGYALVQHRPTLYALYCVDNLIFFGAIALTTYVHKIAPADELKSTLSMGVTMNHVTSVFVPLVGGVVWHYFGYEVIFFSGAVVSFLSLIVSQWVDPEAEMARQRIEAGRVQLQPAVAGA